MNTNGPGMTAASEPSTLTRTRYLTGVHDGWHAIAQDALRYSAETSSGIQVVSAECGDLVRLAPKYGAYLRDRQPVTNKPCHVCAWTVAVDTATVEHEIQLTRPDVQETAAFARQGIDPSLIAVLCRAILAAADDPAGPAAIRQLAAVTEHRPGLAVSEECAEGGCDNRPCLCPDSRLVCWACSLRTGDEAGEWAGSLMDECTFNAPCSVLAGLARHYGLEIPISR